MQQRLLSLYQVVTPALSLLAKRPRFGLQQKNKLSAGYLTKEAQFWETETKAPQHGTHPISLDAQR